MRVKKRWLCGVFVVAILGTEFAQIQMLSGALRPYHFLIPLALVMLSKHVVKLFGSKVFWALFAFFLINFLSAMLSMDPLDAFRSMGLLVLNMSIALVVGAIIVSRHLDVHQVIRIVVAVAIVSVVFGIFQLTMYRLFAVDLALSESQGLQLLGGFSSGLRTEANGFAKFLNVTCLLALPALLTEMRAKRSMLIAAIIVVGMLTSLTRSALYGLAATFVLIYLSQLARGRARLLAARPLTILGVGAFGLAVFASVAGNFNEYAAHKLALFFDSEEIFHGGSSSFRLMSQNYLWDAFLASNHTILIGNGWGQVEFAYGERLMQAGGAEIVVALAYGGVLGGVAYLMYMAASFLEAAKYSKAASSSRDRAAAQGVVMAVMGVFITGQINGAMVAPEYWLVIGLALGLSTIQERAIRSPRIGLPAGTRMRI